jgi:hypothetical protein
LESPMAIQAEPKTQQFLDVNGVPLAGARLFYFTAGTTTPKTVYSNFALTIAHSNPLTADSFGRFANVFVGPGSYKFRVTTAAGVLICEADDIPGEPDTATIAPGSGGTTIPTGFIIPAFDDQPVAGWVRASGGSIGNAASGASERANADTSALFTLLWNRDSGHDLLTISGGRGASAAADFAAAKTILLPDGRGRTLVGLDNLGGSAANRLVRATTIDTTNGSTAAVVGATEGVYPGVFILSANVPAGTVVVSRSGFNIVMSAAATATQNGTAARFTQFREVTWLGATAGASYQRLGLTELPEHQHNVVVPNHSHTIAIQAATLGAGSGASTDFMVPGGSTSTAAAVLGTLTAAPAGLGQDFTNMPPATLCGYYIKL